MSIEYKNNLLEKKENVPGKKKKKIYYFLVIIGIILSIISIMFSLEYYVMLRGVFKIG